MRLLSLDHKHLSFTLFKCQLSCCSRRYCALTIAMFTVVNKKRLMVKKRIPVNLTPVFHGSYISTVWLNVHAYKMDVLAFGTKAKDVVVSPFLILFAYLLVLFSLSTSFLCFLKGLFHFFSFVLRCFPCLHRYGNFCSNINAVSHVYSACK